MKLVYTAITSLDGYVNDESGNFDWAAPDEEVHAFVNDLERDIGTYLYGRRLYEVMVAWETMQSGEPTIQDYTRIWQAADKVVYSRTLAEPQTPRTSVEHSFDPAEVQRRKAEATLDLTIGGATLAGAAIRAGLVDELHQLVTPVVVGGGTSWLPDGVRLHLELLGERRFAGGFVFLRYRVR